MIIVGVLFFLLGKKASRYVVDPFGARAARSPPSLSAFLPSKKKREREEKRVAKEEVQRHTAKEIFRKKIYTNINSQVKMFVPRTSLPPTGWYCLKNGYWSSCLQGNL